MYHHQQGGTGGAAPSTPLVTAVKDDPPALLETTALAVASTDRLSDAIVQRLGENNARHPSSGSALLLVLDATHPALMAVDLNNVAGDKIRDRRAVRVPETDVARRRETTGSTGIDTMAEIKIEHNQRELARKVKEFLRRNPDHHGSAA